MSIFESMRSSTIFLFLLTLLFAKSSLAQDGLPFITNVELSRQYSDSRIGGMVQDAEETMFFSTSRGLLKYDGTTWERISTPSPVRFVYHHASSKRIFLGLKSGAMELVKSDSGSYLVDAIPGINSIQSVRSIIGSSNEVFFIGENEIYELNPQTNSPAEQYRYENRLISGAFLNDGNLFVLLFQEGLFRWASGELLSLGNYTQIAENPVLFSIEAGKKTFVGFEDDMLYSFESNRFNPIGGEVQAFLSNNLLSDGVLLNDSLMAFSTLAGGAIVVNSKDYSIQYRFDYTTGAKDNEIFCLGTDREDGLWFAYDAGLSRVDFSQPIKSFNGYPGIEGSLTTSIISKGVLHVGTGNGVFVLKPATNKEELNRMMREMRQKKTEAKREQEEESNYLPSRPEKQSKKDNKSISLLEKYEQNPDEVKDDLSRKELRELKKQIRRKRKNERQNKDFFEVIEDAFSKNKEESEPKAEGSDENPTSTPKTSTSTGTTTSNSVNGNAKGQKPEVLNKIAKGSKAQQNQTQLNQLNKTFVYKKVKGIDVKCRQFISLNDDVFAATNNGLYIINGESSNNLTPGLYINHVTVSNDKSELLIASLSGVYRLSNANSGTWQLEALNDSVQFTAYNISQDSEGQIWAGTDNGAYHYGTAETRFYSIPEVVNEKVLAVNAYGEMHFLLPTALFRYVATSDTILPATLPNVPNSDRLEYLLGHNDIIWVRSGTGWHVINGERFLPMLPYLDLFEDVRSITSDNDGNLYVIDGGLNLSSVMSKTDDAKVKFNVYINKVVNSAGQPFSLQDLKIESADGALVFKVSAPFYLKSQGTQYQYRIEGLRENWSRWSDNPEIDPGNIPPGDYTLQVRARNILGDLSEIKTLSFSVPQRLFLRWYFLLLYAALLSIAIFGLIKYREKSLKETQRILEEKVAQRTADLEKEKVKTEELLLNILPKDTAVELQKHGKATARHYNQVSVLFTDFKGFTEFAESTKPEELVNELDRCFIKFDEIIGKHYLEKIKTIGDAYMCAGGVPIRNNSNAIAITLGALAIRDFMDEVVRDKKTRNEPVLEIRIGIHTGPLTAGVVGMKKFAYDIWGDTVNTASRMETASEPGRVNVSGATYELIKKYFDCEHRGAKEVKGKGKVEMYFVNRIKPEFSEGGDGVTPSKDLWDIIS